MYYKVKISEKLCPSLSIIDSPLIQLTTPQMNSSRSYEHIGSRIVQIRLLMAKISSGNQNRYIIGHLLFTKVFKIIFLFTKGLSKILPFILMGRVGRILNKSARIVLKPNLDMGFSHLLLINTSNNTWCSSSPLMPRRLIFIVVAPTNKREKRR